jgi:hypothetical protein
VFFKPKRFIQTAVDPFDTGAFFVHCFSGITAAGPWGKDTRIGIPGDTNAVAETGDSPLIGILKSQDPTASLPARKTSIGALKSGTNPQNDARSSLDFHFFLDIISELWYKIAMFRGL